MLDQSVQQITRGTVTMPKRRPQSETRLRAVAGPGVRGPTGNALTVVARIRPERVDELDAFLTAIGNDVRGNPHIRFDSLQTVHFMRWVVLRRGAHTLDADYLLMESNYDGTLDDHLSDLLNAGAEALHRIYQHCEEYGARGSTLGESEKVALSVFLARRAVPYAAFYVANGGKSASRIVEEAACYAEIQRFLDAQGDGIRALSPRVLYGKIRDHLRAEGILARLEAPQPPQPKRDGVLHLAGRLVPKLAGPVAALPLLAPWLRAKEAHDEVWNPSLFKERFERVPTLAAQEDRKVQNPLTHVVQVKEGPLRKFLLKRVLATIDLLARSYFNQGDLGGIPTIHFARWALIEDDQTLVFFSNYDGSWENYLGDFIDIASVGLTAVWSNTWRFPRTYFLIGAGARDEERFKSWTRAHQVYTQVWYTAYPDLTVKNISDNDRIARGLVSDLTDETSVREWLQLL